jgi:hypothetical protein
MPDERARKRTLGAGTAYFCGFDPKQFAAQGHHAFELEQTFELTLQELTSTHGNLYYSLARPRARFDYPLARPRARFDYLLARPRARFDYLLARPRARFDLRHARHAGGRFRRKHRDFVRAYNRAFDARG